MRGTTFTKGKMNYFGLFSQQRTWAPLAQGAPAPALASSIDFFGLHARREEVEGVLRRSVVTTKGREMTIRSRMRGIYTLASFRPAAYFNEAGGGVLFRKRRIPFRMMNTSQEGESASSPSLT